MYVSTRVCVCVCLGERGDATDPKETLNDSATYSDTQQSVFCSLKATFPNLPAFL